MEFIVVLVTCPKDKSKNIANQIVEQRLAACVNVVEEVTSLYWWKENLEDDIESLLIIKTRANLFKSLQKMVTSIHPYENPEIIALPIVSGSSKYLEWVKEETKKISN